LKDFKGVQESTKETRCLHLIFITFQDSSEALVLATAVLVKCSMFYKSESWNMSCAKN